MCKSAQVRAGEHLSESFNRPGIQSETPEKVLICPSEAGLVVDVD